MNEFSTLIDLLRLRAVEQPDELAYTFIDGVPQSESSLTYAGLDRKARAIGAWLQSMNMYGERVLLLYPPGLEYIAALFGCLYAGAVAVPAYPPRPNRSLLRIQSIVASTRAAIALSINQEVSRIGPLLSEVSTLKTLRCFATDALQEELASRWHAPRVTGDNLAILQYTSGSTAAPKGVMVSHNNVLHNERMIQRAFRQTEKSITVGWLPLYHDMGLIGNLFQPLYVGGRCILMSPMSFLQRPFRWLEAISNYKATTSGGPDFAYDLCVRKVSPQQVESLDLSSWAVAFNGSEAIRNDTLERFAQTFAPCGFRPDSFYPCYGLAEATLIVSGGLKEGRPVTRTVLAKALEAGFVADTSIDEQGDKELVSCGKVPAELKVEIVNPDTLTLSSPGEVGEIWVSGTSVARGYWNQPEETERTFMAYISPSGEGPFLRTGDLGFFSDGELFVTGRIKDLIIIRGLNYYPQDIELTVERSHSALRPGCSAAFSITVDGQERLAIVQEVEHRSRADADTLIEIIRRAVVDTHEIHAYAIVLVKTGSVSKTSSGKTQRSLCRGRYLAGELEVVKEWRDSNGLDEADDSQALLENEESLEAWLLSRLAAKLKIDPRRIDVNRSALSYGLDSLVAIDLMHAIESGLGVALPMTAFLQDASIANLVNQVQRVLPETTRAERDSIAQDREAISEHPLSYGQQALWLLHQLEPDSSAYNLTFAARVLSELDIESLRGAFKSLVSRHASLRTVFITKRGNPVQQVLEQSDICFSHEDASGWANDFLNRRLVEEADRPFNLAQGPLLRLSLFTRAAHEGILLLSAHHLIADFWSLSLIVHELGLLYRAKKGNDEISLPQLPLRYTDYARRQAETLSNQTTDDLWSYWRKQLSGELPLLNLTSKSKKAVSQGSRGASRYFRLDEELTRKLKELSLTHNATLFMTLMAAFHVLLYRYSGQEDILVGTPTSGRTRADLAGLVGYFVNPVVIRADLSGSPTFEQVLKQVSGTVLAAFDHQDYPFPLLVERLQPAREPGRSPIFQAMFVYQKTHLQNEMALSSFALGEAGAQIEVGGLRLESMPLEHRASQFDLMLMMAEAGEGLAASLQYRVDLFEAETIARMENHFRALLESIVPNPAQRIGRLGLLTSPERHQLLVEWNDTSAAPPYESCIHEMFERQVERTPDSIAAVFENERLTYYELNQRANKLGRYLRALGAGPETRIAVCMNRSIEMLVGLLGILKAGAAYVPLDPSYPRERLEFVLKDACAPVLLTQSSLQSQLPANSARLICLDAEWSAVATQSAQDIESGASENNLAYVIYTSGSTGRPKGVAIEHLSAVTFLNWVREAFSHHQMESVLASTSICFDLSIFELFGPLTCGGKVVLTENALHVRALSQANEITLINTVPSAIAELLRDNSFPASVNTVNLAGEALQGRLVEQLYQVSSIKHVYNLYGPTEDTTYSTFALMKRNSGENPTIGRPILNTRTYVLNSELEPVPVGTQGDLYLAGAGLARGYLNRAELTAERFIPDPFAEQQAGRLYKTGDVACYLPDANIEFLGRSDHQVKLRGFRIEMGETESALVQHPAIREAVVLTGDDGRGDKRLVAYLVKEPGASLQTGEVRALCMQKLPHYMVPSVFIQLDAMPLTPNGKLDRKALPAYENLQPELQADSAGPRNQTEERLKAIWVETLGTARVGIYNDFFELGGHSLMASQMLSEVRDTFQIEVPLRSFFESPNIAALAEAINRLEQANKKFTKPAIVSASRVPRRVTTSSQGVIIVPEVIKEGH